VICRRAFDVMQLVMAGRCWVSPGEGKIVLRNKDEKSQSAMCDFPKDTMHYTHERRVRSSASSERKRCGESRRGKLVKRANDRRRLISEHERHENRPDPRGTEPREKLEKR
jgi:hypothetical protein